jgi:hypothetical protein
VSDGDDEEGGAGSAAGWGIGRWITLAGWLLAAVLGGNLVVAQLRTGEGARPAGFLSEQTIVACAFWLPVAVLVIASVLGILWTMRVYVRREKSSLLWMRNAFVFGLVSALLLALASQEARIFKREWLAAWCAFLAAAQVSLFAYAAYREMRRNAARRGRRSGDGEGGVGG